MAQNLQAVGGSEERYGHYLDKKRPLEIFIKGLEIADTAQMGNAIGAGPYSQGADIDQLVGGGNSHLDDKLAEQVIMMAKFLVIPSCELPSPLCGTMEPLASAIMELKRSGYIIA